MRNMVFPAKVPTWSKACSRRCLWTNYSSNGATSTPRRITYYKHAGYTISVKRLECDILYVYIHDFLIQSVVYNDYSLVYNILSLHVLTIVYIPMKDNERICVNVNPSNPRKYKMLVQTSDLVNTPSSFVRGAEFCKVDGAAMKAMMFLKTKSLQTHPSNGKPKEEKPSSINSVHSDWQKVQLNSSHLMLILLVSAWA